MSVFGCDISGKFPAVRSSGEDETGRIGECLADRVYPGLLVMLSGDLGAGKTALVRSIGAALGVSGIKSPTFSIESVHKIPSRRSGVDRLVHADLYRVEDPYELAESFEEGLGEGVLLFVEWSERWKDAPICDRWDIDIKQSVGACGQDARFFEMSAFGERAVAALSRAYEEILDSCP